MAAWTVPGCRAIVPLYRISAAQSRLRCSTGCACISYYDSAELHVARRPNSISRYMVYVQYDTDQFGIPLCNARLSLRNSSHRSHPGNQLFRGAARRDLSPPRMRNLHLWQRQAHIVSRNLRVQEGAWLSLDSEATLPLLRYHNRVEESTPSDVRYVSFPLISQ